MNVNFSIFSNHHTIIGGCTAPASDARKFIVELTGVLLYHYVVLYQDPSGNEQRVLSPILSHCFENMGERTSHRALLQMFIKNTYLELFEYQLISIGKQAFKVFTHDRKNKDANITFWKLMQCQSSKYKLNERRARRVGEGDKSDPHLVSATLANSFSHRDCSIWRYLSASRTAREILRSCCTAPKVSAAQDTLCAHRTIMSNWCLTRSTRSTDSLSVHSGASSWRYAKFNPFNEPWRTTTNWQMPRGQFGRFRDSAEGSTFCSTRLWLEKD